MKYHIKEFTYKSKGLKMIIYARSLATAEQIIYLDNQFSSFYWKPVIFRFSKRVLTDIPPYELEQMQLETSLKQLEYRKSHQIKQ